VPRRRSSSELRQELELRLAHGRCAYCGARGSPDEPLTREHLIPRSRGGGRHDHGIIVPACARCNHKRGCKELVLFLLIHPPRLLSLLDHFESLPAATLQQVDARIFAELYAAQWLLGDCVAAGSEWRDHVRHLRSGRALHRRRYAARRIVVSAAERLRAHAPAAAGAAGASCLIPPADAAPETSGLQASLRRAQRRLLDLLALAWRTSPANVEGALQRAWAAQPQRSVYEQNVGDAERAWASPPERRRPSRRLRVDRRQGRGARRRNRRYPNRRAA
jgi:hypothetical protein